MKLQSLLAFILVVLMIFVGTFAGVKISNSQPPSSDQFTVALWHFDEGTGVFAYDATGINNGTIVGASWVSGMYGTALSFDGVNDNVRVLDDVSLHVQELTIEAWVKIGTGRQIIVKKLLDTSWGSYILRIDDTNKLEFTVQRKINQTNAITPVWKTVNTLTSNVWYHLMATFKKQNYDSTDGKIYINGTEQTTTFTANGYASGFTIEYSPGTLYIGGQPGLQPFLEGIIDEVRISNIARTPMYGPTASFTYTPEIVYANETVTFNATFSLPGWNGTSTSPIVSYEWNFGDTHLGTGMIVNHTYSSANQYNVTLIVTDEQGINNTAWEILDVLSPPLGPIFRITPQSYSAYRPKETFVMNVSIVDIADLYGWEFKLYYTSMVLNATSLAEGPFLASLGSTYFHVITFTDTFNATHGLIHATCTLTEPGSGVDGNGTLATLTFKTKSPGDTLLYFQDTIVIDSNDNPISHTTQHGIVHFQIVMDVYTQKGGIGPGEPSDAFSPQSTIILYGRVVYNKAPIPNFPVQFALYDPLGNPTLRTATTNQDGLATSSIITSATWLHGNYTLIAATEIQQRTFNDTASLRFGWTVNILQVTCCDNAGNPQSSFGRDKLMYLNITLDCIALGQQPLVLLIDLTDEIGDRIGYQWIRFMIPTGKSGMIIGLRVPPWSIPGTAQLRVDAYSSLPWSGGTIYCPGKTLSFIIKSG